MICAEGDGLDIMNILSDTWPTAKKEHTCSECGRAIAAGEFYHRIVYADRKGLSTSKVCLDCESLVDAFFCGEARAIGLVREDVRTMLAEESKLPAASCMRLLTTGAREWVCGALEREWEREEREDAVEAN